VQSERIPAYAYVICDTTKELEIIAQNKSLLPHARPTRLLWLQSQPIGLRRDHFYTKLLRDAKKRNRILFDKLPPAYRELTLPVAWRYIDMLYYIYIPS
jgi:hypothetical protein